MARASYGSPSANEPHGPGPHALRRLGARALVGSRSQHGRLRERFADYPRRNDALCAPIGDSGHALPPPLGVWSLPAPYLPAGDGERLALPGSLLAGVTYLHSPQPNRPNLLPRPASGEKTNLTQKEPYRTDSVDVPMRDVHRTCPPDRYGGDWTQCCDRPIGYRDVTPSC